MTIESPSSATAPSAVPTTNGTQDPPPRSYMGNQAGAVGVLRATVRLIALVAWFLPLSLVLGVLNLSAWIAPARGGRAIDGLLRIWCRGIQVIMGCRVTVQGTAPPPPFFLVANHLSYMDILVLYPSIRGRFLSKAEVGSWPGIGMLVRGAGTLFIDRARQRDLSRVVPEIQTSLDAGRGVVVFPEGTSTKGSKVERFKPSIFEVPIRTGVPVSYAALGYRTPEGNPPAYLSVCWWGDAPFTPHFLSVLTLSRFEASISFGSDPLQAEDRKELASMSQQAVESLFAPVAPTDA